MSFVTAIEDVIAAIAEQHVIACQAKILERDIGKNTDMATAGIDAYHPEGWALVGEE